MNSRTTRRFRELLAALPTHVRQQARGAYQLFRQNPSHPRLHFKKVHHRLLERTAETSTTFEGEIGSSYSFYVVATDYVGHRQTEPATAQALTTLVPDNTAPVATAQAGLTTDEDVSLSGGVTGQDVDDDPLTFQIAEQSGNGTVTLDPNTGAFTYCQKR